MKIGYENVIGYATVSTAYVFSRIGYSSFKNDLASFEFLSGENIHVDREQWIKFAVFKQDSGGKSVGLILGRNILQPIKRQLGTSYLQRLDVNTYIISLYRLPPKVNEGRG